VEFSGDDLAVSPPSTTFRPETVRTPRERRSSLDRVPVSGVDVVVTRPDGVTPPAASLADSVGERRLLLPSRGYWYPTLTGPTGARPTGRRAAVRDATAVPGGTMTDRESPSTTRRAVLAGAAGGVASSLAGCSLLESGADGDTAGVDDDRALELAERFAPTIRFDSRERWFPTDPRQFERDRDGDTVVDGFDALNEYV